MTKEEQYKLNNWTKDQIYEAYLTEVNERMKLNKEVNKLNRKLAEIRHLAGQRD